MQESLKRGDHVRNTRSSTLGIGKVVYATSSLVTVYFKKPAEPLPEKRVFEYRLPSEVLELVADAPADPELDNLPPFVDGRFKRAKTDLTLHAARDLFFTTYPRGFDDPAYHDPMVGERGYKVLAHQRFLDLREDLATMELKDLRAAFWRVYDGLDHKTIFPLNIMHPRFEAPRFFDALDDLDWAARYRTSVLAFIEAPASETFAELADALVVMPGVEPARTGRWPYMTWLPFVADPTKHIAIRPTFIQEFASAAAFHIPEISELDYATYARVIELARWLLTDVDTSGLNTSRRTLDMIDAQSFMWVARRYSEPGFEGPKR